MISGGLFVQPNTTNFISSGVGLSKNSANSQNIAELQ